MHKRIDERPGLGNAGLQRKLRLSGYAFAFFFTGNYLLNLFRDFGRTGSWVAACASWYQLALLLAIAIFLASSRWARLRWLQGATFLALSSIPILERADSAFGLACFVIGALLLERSGAFRARRRLKAALLLVAILALETISLILSRRPFLLALSHTFYLACFGGLLWFLYKDRLAILLREPKTRLSLSERGLSPAERCYVLEAVRGKLHKEIAFDYELAESTVRNTLARAYRKLAVEDRAGLAVLAERFEIVE